MRIPKLTKTEWIVVGVIAFVLVAIVVPPPVAVWDGHFRLTIAIHEDEPIDRDSLRIATCWFERDVEGGLADVEFNEYGFHTPGLAPEGDAVIDMPTSGRVGGWGTTDTYNHPEYLVVEYRLAGGDNLSLERRVFSIPKGRGPRTMTIDLTGP